MAIAVEDLNAINGDIVGGDYQDGVLRPGCLVCGTTIPEKQAKFRSKVCSDACRNAYRRWRGLPSADRAAAPLRCQVCRGEIPHRPNINWVEVCSTACRNAMRRYRFQVLQNQKCPHCYHPSSPAEWEQFRQWRASKGPMQEFFREAHGRGNFAWKREKELREALRDAVGALQGELAVILTSYASETTEGLPVRSSLSPDGELLAQPLEKIIKRAETLLKPKKKADEAEVEESTLVCERLNRPEEESNGTQS